MDSAAPESELDDLLVPKPSAPRSDLRNAILHRTVRRIRVRGRVRWAIRTGALAACFLAGMGTLWLFHSAEPPEKVVVVEMPTTNANQQTPISAAPLLSPQELEVEAEKSLVQAESARQFRQAGDRYLKEEGNYEAALRCYRNFLDMAEPDDLSIVETDNWLLMSLKHARQTEVKHAYGDN